MILVLLVIEQPIQFSMAIAAQCPSPVFARAPVRIQQQSQLNNQYKTIDKRTTRMLSPRRDMDPPVILATEIILSNY